MEQDAQDGQTALHRAAHDGSLAQFVAALNKDIPDDATDDDKFALHQARVHITDHRGYAPFHVACEQGHQTLVQFMIDRFFVTDQDVTQKLPGDGTPLHLAARKGHLHVVQLLLKQGASPIAPGDPSGGPALADAAWENYPDIVHALIEAGTPVDTLIMDNSSSLHLAAHNNAIDVIRVLAEFDAQVNRRTAYGKTPLHMAIEGGHVDAVRALLSVGANPVGGKQAPDGEDFVVQATEGKHDDIVALLIQARKDPSKFVAGGAATAKRTPSGVASSSLRESHPGAESKKKDKEERKLP